MSNKKEQAGCNKSVRNRD